MIEVDTTRRTLAFCGTAYPCIIGRSGAVPAAAKREGDGATPIGDYRLLAALLRPDRRPPGAPGLPWRWLRPWDGWSDDVTDPQYNRAVARPHRFGSEQLWRADCCYDVIVVLDHNSRPVVAGAGSAIFWHLARPGQSATEGCVAVAPEVMQALLPALAPGLQFRIRAA